MPKAGATRYGEADYPGPGGQTVSIGPVEYQRPDQIGAHGAMLEMSPNEEWHDSGGRRFALKIDTTNATSWGAMRRYLRRTDADLILAQEHQRRSRRSPPGPSAGGGTPFSPLRSAATDRGGARGWPSLRARSLALPCRGRAGISSSHTGLSRQRYLRQDTDR
jgi:hypothetical protein